MKISARIWTFFFIQQFVVLFSKNRLRPGRSLLISGYSSLRLRGGSTFRKYEPLNHTVQDDDYEYRNDGHGEIFHIPRDFATFDQAVETALRRAQESVSILKPLIYISDGSYLMDRKYLEVAVSKNGWQYHNYHAPIYLNGRKCVRGRASLSCVADSSFRPP